MIETVGPRAVSLIAIALLCSASVAEYQSAKRKASLIEADRVPPHGSVVFTPGEVNAYAAEEARKEVPEGLRSPHLTFARGTIRGTALVDFAKVSTARGTPPGILIAMLLSGERPVTVDVAVQTRDGMARVDVQKVAIGSATLAGRALELVIEYYVLPRYPEAAIGRWFPLRHNVKSIVVAPAGVTFKFGSPAPPPPPQTPVAQ
jgi:hypothetical protein